MSAPGTNWQIMLADLSILLFLTSLSALAQVSRAPVPPVPAASPAVAQPVAVWRAGRDAPSLADWLKSQALDSRMRINVHAGYRPEARARIVQEAVDISSDPALAGRAVRLILEPARSDFVTVTLSFDRT